MTGGLVGWLANCFLNWFVDCLVGRQAGWLFGELVGWLLVGRFTCWSCSCVDLYLCVYICSICSWFLLRFCCSLTYYGISFGIKNLAGDFFLNFFLMAVVEVPPSLFVYHLSGTYLLCVCTRSGVTVCIPCTLTLTSLCPSPSARGRIRDVREHSVHRGAGWA